MVCATLSQVQVDILLGWQILILTLSLMIEIFVVNFYDDTVCSGSYNGCIYIVSCCSPNLTLKETSLPYFGLKLSCDCLTFACRKKCSSVVKATP